MKHFDSDALLRGKLFDDKGNLIRPSFSTKNGVRYRFYVSSALLRGRKAAAGSVGRVSAAPFEATVRSALVSHRQMEGFNGLPLDIDQVERVVVFRDRLSIELLASYQSGAKRLITVP